MRIRCVTQGICFYKQPKKKEEWRQWGYLGRYTNTKGTENHANDIALGALAMGLDKGFI